LNFYKVLRAIDEIAHGKEINLKEWKREETIGWNYHLLEKWAKKEINPKILESIEFFKNLK
jgi:hypothetical protein